MQLLSLAIRAQVTFIWKSSRNLLCSLQVAFEHAYSTWSCATDSPQLLNLNFLCSSFTAVDHSPIHFLSLDSSRKTYIYSVSQVTWILAFFFFFFFQLYLCITNFKKCARSIGIFSYLCKKVKTFKYEEAKFYVL